MINVPGPLKLLKLPRELVTNLESVLTLPEREGLKLCHLSLSFPCNHSERQQQQAMPGGLLLTWELKLVTKRK